MKGRLFATVASAAFVMIPGVALADTQDSETNQPDSAADTAADTPVDASARPTGRIITVTATRREMDLQDVPLSITAFGQEELSEMGVVGYEGLAHETPGVVVNKPTANFNNFSARGLAINGYNANLQSTVAIYIDELPVSANGNSTILDPNLYDVERVEFLRGPQGTLFGSGSLAGALRIITKSPNLHEYEASGLVDLGITGSDSIRQRYNGVVNVPLVDGKLGLRAVGFYRHEEGWVDNVGTGGTNTNTLVDYGGRAILQWEPDDRFSARLLVSYENSKPQDSGLINPLLDDDRETRRSDEPDLFQGELTSFNATLKYDFDFAELTSSSTLSSFNQLFYVDLANTFGHTLPFALDADAYDDIFVEEMRLTSDTGGRIDWTVGGFYYYKRRDVDFNYRSSLDYLAAHNMTGLQDEYYQSFRSYTVSHELAAFGELTYRFGDKFWLTGGLRYGSADAQSYTVDGGFSSNYLINAIFGIDGPLTVTPVAAEEGLKAEGSKLSYKVSASFRPNDDITTYATISTGFRTPIVNARAGLASVIDPNDIIIPDGAGSDKLTNYEVGFKGSFLDGHLFANVAAYWVDWSNIQVQANRVSDSIQFATNIGKAVSKGVEFEITAIPVTGLTIDLVGSINDAKVDKLSDAEAAISGAVLGAQLAFPHFQGTARVKYDFALSDSADGWVSASISHVGDYPGLFQNVPGQPGTVSPTFSRTESFEVVNLAAGTKIDDLSLMIYVENLLDDHSLTYVHPEVFLDSRFGTLRPRTAGIRIGYAF